MKEGGGKSRIFIVDDHLILREGLKLLLDQDPELTVVGDAGNEADAMAGIARTHPDVVIADLWLRDSSGIEMIRAMHVRYPSVMVLVLSLYEEAYYAERVLRAGARGFVAKAEAPSVLIQAIKQMLKGEIYLSESMSAMMLSKYIEGPPDTGHQMMDRLSDRELEVFEYIGHGLGTRQIADRLHLSVKTIESHRANIKKKLKLESATELLQHAIQWVQYEKVE